MSCAEALRELSQPWPPGDRVKTAISRAASLAGLAYWRAFDIWYDKAHRVDEIERDAIADALEKKRDEAARNEFHELKLRLARLESLFAQTDSKTHRPRIDLVSRPVRCGGRKSRCSADAVGC